MSFSCLTVNDETSCKALISNHVIFLQISFYFSRKKLLKANFKGMAGRRKFLAHIPNLRC